MAQNFAQVFWPGIDSIESFQMTDYHGISPAVGQIVCNPQDAMPALQGDLTLTYNGETIVFTDCRIDAFSVQKDSGGRVVSVRILDERWRWKYGQITGRYNIRMPNNFVSPPSERTPHQLAALLFAAMGVVNYDISALPNDDRPDVNWTCANPADELAKMCDKLGCRIVPQRISGIWAVCRLGDGAPLSDALPYQDPLDGINPMETPDYIQVVTAPTLYQVSLRLRACSKDLNGGQLGGWQDLDSLSYTPNPNSPIPDACGFGRDTKFFSMLSRFRGTLGDGTKISPREMGLRYVFRSYRIDNTPSTFQFRGRVRTTTGVNGEPAFFLPGFNGYVTRRQLILSDHLVQSWTDAYGEIHQRPSYVWGQFYAPKHPGLNAMGNTPLGTRIDYQSQFFTTPPGDSTIRFSLANDPVDTDKSIISTTDQLTMRFVVNNPANPAQRIDVFDQAQVFYCCAVQVRDPVTWQPTAYFRARQIGTGGDETHVWTFVKPEIQPWIITLYNSDGTPSYSYNNQDEVNTQCDYYLDLIQSTLETIATGTRTYIGWYPLNLDGALQQATYRMGKNGADLIVSRGTEHDFEQPTYRERRQRDGRQGYQEKRDLEIEILRRAVRLQGTFNT